MIIREYTPGDLADIRRIHGQRGYSFELPNFEDPLMLVKKCMVDERDSVQMAAFGRLHINALLFVDGTWGTAKQRLEAILELQQEMMKEARLYGLDIASTQMEGRFARRMQSLGWQPGWGQMFFREIK